MEKGAVEIYKKIVLWVSLVLVIVLFFWEVFEINGISNNIIRFIIVTPITIVHFLFIVYSVIMLVYILAKKRAKEYTFGFVVPLLLVLIPFIVGLSFWGRLGLVSPFGWISIISMAVLFLYALYDKWELKKK